MVQSDATGGAHNAATEPYDYFFASYVTPQAQRLRAVKANGVAHASDISPRDPLPSQPVTVSIVTDAALPIDHVAVYVTTDGAVPDGARGQAPQGFVVLAEPRSGDENAHIGDTPVRHWQAIIPGQPDGTLVRYRIDAWSGGDPARRWVADAADPFAAPAPAGREFAYHVDRREAPDWVHDAIIYQIFVDRFAAAGDQPPLRDPGSLTGFYGGTLRGIIEELDYISALGVNCLWLSPVMESPTYHGYNPSSYADVSPRYGTNADLRDLIAHAHARGMRVLLDFVANHTSNEHPAFLDARLRGESSPSYGMYAFGSEYRNGYLTYYGVTGMPVLRTDAEPARDYLIEAARRWLTDFGADGLRLDNVSGPTHAFWTMFQEGVKATSPDALTLGEVSGGIDDIVTYSGRMDACMDFPLAKVIRRVFAQRAAPLDELLAMLDAHEAAFSPAMARARLLDNHDMHRFLWLAKDDTRRLTLALTVLMTLPGFPVLYYGTEVGLSQRGGPDGKDVYAREPMRWGSDQRADLLRHVRWLVALRREHPALRRGHIARVPVTLLAGADGQVGAFARWTTAEAALVVINNGDAPAQLTIEPRGFPFAWETPAPPETAERAWLLTPDQIAPLPVPPLAQTLNLPAFSAALLLRAAGG